MACAGGMGYRSWAEDHAAEDPVPSGSGLITRQRGRDGGYEWAIVAEVGVHAQRETASALCDTL